MILEAAQGSQVVRIPLHPDSRILGSTGLVVECLGGSVRNVLSQLAGRVCNHLHLVRTKDTASGTTMMHTSSARQATCTAMLRGLHQLEERGSLVKPELPGRLSLRNRG